MNTKQPKRHFIIEHPDEGAVKRVGGKGGSRVWFLKTSNRDDEGIARFESVVDALTIVGRINPPETGEKCRVLASPIRPDTDWREWTA